MYRIFIVEDDTIISGKIAEALESWDMEAAVCGDLRNVTEELIAFDPHLVLLDISLPFFSGYYWCGEIRKFSRVPIMFISSAGDDMSIVMAINMGADDFVAKPFDMQLLLAKVQALLRRSYDFSSAGHSSVFEHDGMIFDSSSCTVTYGDEKVELSKNENRILTVLIENKGHVVSRDTLMNRLWETDMFVDENTLSVNIARLRKTLSGIGIEDMIKTRKGSGYIIE